MRADVQVSQDLELTKLLHCQLTGRGGGAETLYPEGHHAERTVTQPALGKLPMCCRKQKCEIYLYRKFSCKSLIPSLVL